MYNNTVSILTWLLTVGYNNTVVALTCWITGFVSLADKTSSEENRVLTTKYINIKEKCETNYKGSESPFILSWSN